MKIALEIEGDKFPFFLELLDNLIFVTNIEIESDSNDDFGKKIKLTITQKQELEHRKATAKKEDFVALEKLNSDLKKKYGF